MAMRSLATSANRPSARNRAQTTCASHGSRNRASVTSTGDLLRCTGGGAGAGSQNRTDDLPLTRRLLYQLSYAGERAGILAQRRAIQRACLGGGDVLRGARRIERRGGAGVDPAFGADVPERRDLRSESGGLALREA